MKVGRHPGVSNAVLSHSGAASGEDNVFDAALRRAGVIRLYTMASSTPRPARCSRTSARAATGWQSSPTAAARA
jgi:hypothetical protein